MKINLFQTPYHLSLLAELGKPETRQPEVSRLLEALYGSLFSLVADRELATQEAEIPTRMLSADPRGVYRGSVIRKDQQVVVVNLIRAGTEPSALFYRKLTEILDPAFVRQDHIMAQRIEAEKGISGTSLMASKIGGSVEGAVVILPDPMGATGHSLRTVIEFYLNHYGTPKMFVPVHLVVSPEYLASLRALKCPLSLYAARQDQGLTEEDYIYPGLGGMGEVINNTTA